MRRSLSRLAALARRALLLGGNRPARSKPRRRVLRSLSMQGLESRSMFAVASPTDWGNDKLVNPTGSGRVTRSFSDRFESNNTVATATNLGVRVGNSMVGSLAIGPASTPDRDVFRFSTTQTGTSANYIDILFTHASGDLDARLLDSAGNQLAASEGTSNNERLSMSNRAAGTYFVEVYGYRSAVNNYDLDLRLPGMTADRFEANDTRQTATDLQTLSGASTVSDLSINTTTDRDFYRITTTGAGTSAHYVDVLFTHGAGDIDARLLDASGNTLANSTGTVNNERLSLSGRAPGTYFVEVFGYSGAVNRYSLDFRAPAGIAPDVYESNDTRATSSDLGTVAGQLNLSNLSIHSSSDRDFYRLATTATGTAAHYIDVNFTHAQGDIDARLLNAAGEVLATSVTTSDRERLSLQGRPAGTYFLEVYGYSGSVNRYGMEVNTPGGLVADRYELNDSVAAATNLGSIAGEQSVSDLSIHTASDRDFYRFTTTATGTAADAVTINFIHANGDIDARLLDSAGNPLASSQSTSNSERLSLADRPAGTYILEVYGYSGARNRYRLDLRTPGGIVADRFEPNDMQSSATSLGTITGQLSVSNLSVHSGTDRDFYRFSTLGTGSASNAVDIRFAHAIGDIDARLRDSAGNIIASAVGVADNEWLSLQDLPAGTYFVEVYGAAGARNSYSLNIVAPGLGPDRFEQNESIAAATDLRTVAGNLSIGNLNIHSATDRDFFRITTAGLGTAANYIDVLFPHASGDIDARLLDSAGTVLLSASGTQNNERISLEGRPAGTYFVEVYGYSSAVNEYRLDFRTPGAIDPDQYEPNDTRPAAANLRLISGDLSVPDLTITPGNRDVFRFEIAATANATHAVQASFMHADGDVDLQLFDANGQLLRSALGTRDNERISLDGLAAGSYFVEVFGATGSVVNRYSLSFATPVDGSASGPNRDAWTIMVYITGSDLAQAAYRDINEMENALNRLPGTVNLSVFWDQSSAGPADWRYPTGGGSQPAWGTTGRAFLNADSNLNSVGTRFEILPEANTGDPRTLVDFVNWSATMAPAQRYGLILWNHGGGLSGFNFDNRDLGQPADWMTTPELVQALTTLRGNNVPIDLLSFDSCQMAMAEIGYATRGLTTTFVASQENVSNDGHDYNTLFRTLESNPYAVAPSALATGFVRSFGQQVFPANSNVDTHSAINSASYNGLATALRAFTTAASSATASERSAISTARNSASVYGDSGDHRDLGGFMRRIASNSRISNAIRSAATGVVNALAASVISKTSDVRASSGMSIYLPPLTSNLSVSSYAASNSAFNSATGWSQFLVSVASGGRAIAEDWAGGNNTAAVLARDLGAVAGTGLSFNRLSLEGGVVADWFQFTLGQAGTANNSVAALQNGSAATGVVLELFDVSGTTRLATSNSNTLSLAGIAGGRYALRVSSANPVESYSLSFNAPNLPVAATLPNRTADKATNWGVMARNSFVNGSVAASSATSWTFYQFETPRTATLQSLQLTLNVATGVAIDVEIVDAAGRVVSSASNATSNNSALTLNLQPQTASQSFTMRVRQSPSRTAATPAVFNMFVA